MLWVFIPAARLRQEQYRGRTICLVLRYSDFFTFSRHLTVDYFLDSGYNIYKQALKILERIDWQDKAVRMIGINVANLVRYSHQLYLLEEFNRNQKIDGVMDKINNKFGEFTIMRAAMMQRRSLRWND